MWKRQTIGRRKSSTTSIPNPEELIKLIDLSLPDQGIPIGSLLKDCETVLKYSVQTSVEGLLASCNSMRADYLLQRDKFYDPKYDTGDKVIQCERHKDVFKFWLQWRSNRTQGFGAQIDHLVGLNEHCMDLMRKRPDTFIIIVVKPECVNACFCYVPKRYRKEEKTPELYQRLGPIEAKMKELMMRNGSLMVGYHTPNFLHNIISDPACTKEDIEFLVNELDTLGRDL